MKKILFIIIVLLNTTVLFAQTDSTSFSGSNTDKVLASVIQKALEAAETTGQFVIDQAPDLIQQFLSYHLYATVFLLVISFIITLLCARGIFSKKHTEYLDDNDMEILKVLYVIGGLIFCILFLIQVMDLLKILIAPKIYIIEYFVQ